MYYGTEFTSKAKLKWSLDKGVNLNFIEPVKPTQNAFIESLNGKFRHQCLRQHYNHVRPHSLLNYQTPKEVARQHEMIKNQPLDSHSLCIVWGGKVIPPWHFTLAPELTIGYSK